MKIIKILISLTFLFIQKELSAQNTFQLTIGDNLPDIQIDNILNYKTSTLNLSDLQGKVIILDFWGSTCSNCIIALGKIDSLQKVFKNDLQILSVTTLDTKNDVFGVLSRYKKTKNIQLPIVLNGSSLKKYFPHEIVSHVIWIDKRGVIRAITGTEHVTANNIQKIIEGKDVNLPLKNDVLEFDYSKPFLDFLGKKEVTPNFYYYSAFSGALKGIDGGSSKLTNDSLNNNMLFNAFNLGLLQLCKGALGEGPGGTLNEKRVILQVKDPSRYIFNLNTSYYSEWEIENTYCYSLKLPLGTPLNELRNVIHSDLNRWINLLGINVRKERQKQKVWVLKRTSQDDRLLLTKGKESETNFGEDAGGKKKLVNSGLANLLGVLQITPGIPWVIDETKIPSDMRVDMELKIDSFRNLPELRKALKKYGLDMQETEREIEMYVISEKDYKENP